LIDFTASQPQPTAEFAWPLRETIFMNAHQRSRIVGHNRHARWHDRTPMAFVGEVRSAATQQAGNDTFDHRSAVAIGVGEVHLGSSPDAVQVRLIQAPEDSLRCGRRGSGSMVFGIPTVRMPCSCNTSRKAASFSARSPASEWMAEMGRVPTRAIAYSTCRPRALHNSHPPDSPRGDAGQR
jgi:hypothetical protein